MNSRHVYERIALYAALTSLTAISIDAVLPALRVLGEALPKHDVLAPQHVVSLFILGMVFGEILFGPLSDAWGRKKALIAGLAVYAAGTAVAVSAQSMEWVIAGRILQGIGVSGPKIATRALVRDQFEGDAMARVMSFIFMLLILVPMVAPAIGQLVLAFAGWRAIFGLYLGLALILAMWLALRQPETLPPARRIPLRPGTLARNTLRIAANPRVALLTLAAGLVFGSQLLYLGLAADLFFTAYGVDVAFPAYFAAIAVAIGIAAFVNARLVGQFGMNAMARTALGAQAVLGSGLFAWAHIGGGNPPLLVFMGFAAGIFFAIGIVFGNINAMAMQSLGLLAGLGASVIASLSSLVAVLFSLALGAFHDGSVSAVAAGFALAGAGAFLAVSRASGAGIEPVVPVETALG